ncbi:endonuclease/exonuclease/phosphatase family protein [Streptomyces brasiliscabiei]|uniref:endonuclease/exonuclease/phosphatase family protein n=1 Tax=Streptomyces brasiliscabiei TaxID=2736302 RepID=UPI001C11223C|nr:endonuclease/exonuclease/phosphatase family protein [Streptomyces brasiliscabiei]
MHDEGIQGSLFGSLDDEVSPTAEPDALRVCALNINNPSRQRAQVNLNWLLGTGSNVLVLTEMKASDGSRLIISGLEAEGFDTHLPPGWTESPYFTLIATRGFQGLPVIDQFDARAIAVDLLTTDEKIRLVGLYGPTNGMTPESSDRRRVFQKGFLEYLHSALQPKLVLAGDLNVMEPSVQSHLDSFQDHDYAFYTGLQDLGLTDLFRKLHPAALAHSWLSDRYGSQRLDHVFATTKTGTVISCDYDHTPRTAQFTDHAALLTTIALGANA